MRRAPPDCTTNVLRGSNSWLIGGEIRPGSQFASPVTASDSVSETEAGIASAGHVGHVVPSRRRTHSNCRSGIGRPFPFFSLSLSVSFYPFNEREVRERAQVDGVVMPARFV